MEKGIIEFRTRRARKSTLCKLAHEINLNLPAFTTKCYVAVLSIDSAGHDVKDVVADDVCAFTFSSMQWSPILFDKWQMQPITTQLPLFQHRVELAAVSDASSGHLRGCSDAHTITQCLSRDKDDSILSWPTNKAYYKLLIAIFTA
eukprot:scaffold2059_cov129-Skeletonema_dohrnii-CCMP3373.AAC.1